MTKPAIPITGIPEADSLLVEDPLALLIGMLLDQQVPMEWAFRGPHTLMTRLGTLDPEAISEIEPASFVQICSEKPAIHRYPKVMAGRIQALCRQVVEVYGGDASRIWGDGGDASQVLSRLTGLPGYGDEKARVFLAILGKRLSIKPRGWAEAAQPFSDNVPRCVADVGSEADLAAVRAWKKQQKAAARSKSE